MITESHKQIGKLSFFLNVYLFTVSYLSDHKAELFKLNIQYVYLYLKYSVHVHLYFFLHNNIIFITYTLKTSVTLLAEHTEATIFVWVQPAS